MCEVRVGLVGRQERGPLTVGPTSSRRVPSSRRPLCVIPLFGWLYQRRKGEAVGRLSVAS
jgi:hypothetical protein